MKYLSKIQFAEAYAALMQAAGIVGYHAEVLETEVLNQVYLLTTDALDELEQIGKEFGYLDETGSL